MITPTCQCVCVCVIVSLHIQPIQIDVNGEMSILEKKLQAIYIKYFVLLVVWEIAVLSSNFIKAGKPTEEVQKEPSHNHCSSSYSTVKVNNTVSPLQNPQETGLQNK